MSAHILIRAVVRRFSISINEISRLLLVSKSTVRRWITVDEEERMDVPGPAEIVIELLMRGQITLGQLRDARDRVARRWKRMGRL